MIDVKKIKEELDGLIQRISLQWGGLSEKEKKDLLFIADRFLNSMIAFTIFDEQNENN